MIKKICVICLCVCLSIVSLQLTGCTSALPEAMDYYSLCLVYEESANGLKCIDLQSAEYYLLKEKYAGIIWLNEEKKLISISSDSRNVKDYTQDGYNVTVKDEAVNAIYYDIQIETVRTDKVITLKTKFGISVYYFTYAMSYGTSILNFNYNNADSYFPQNSLSSKIVVQGARVGVLPKPKKGETQFLGWYISDENNDWQKIDENYITRERDINVYAKWEGEDLEQFVLTVTLDCQGGSMQERPSYIKVEKGKSIKNLPTPIKSGYTLTEWNTTADGSGITIDNLYIPTASMTIYAIWSKDSTENKYDTYNLNRYVMSIGGVETEISLDDPLYSRILDMYGRSVKISTTQIEFTGSLLSLYNPCTYTLNGETVVLSDSSIAESFNNITLNKNTFKFGVDSGGLLYYFEYVYSETEDIYYTVNFDYNGATSKNSSSDIKVKQGMAAGTLPVPEKMWHVFNGWFAMASGGEKINASTVINANTTVYAQWTKNANKNVKEFRITRYVTKIGSFETEQDLNDAIVQSAIKLNLGFAVLISDNQAAFSGMSTSTNNPYNFTLNGNSLQFAPTDLADYTVSFNEMQNKIIVKRFISTIEYTYEYSLI